MPLIGSSSTSPQPLGTNPYRASAALPHGPHLASQHDELLLRALGEHNNNGGDGSAGVRLQAGTGGYHGMPYDARSLGIPLDPRIMGVGVGVPSQMAFQQQQQQQQQQAPMSRNAR